MLDPHEIIKLRGQVSVASDLTLAIMESGLASSAVAIDASTDWYTVYLEHPQPESVMFKPPSFIIGDPIDRSCLDGIGKSTIHIPPHKISLARNVRVVGWRALLGKDGDLHVGGSLISSKEQLGRVEQQVLQNHQGFLLMSDNHGGQHLIYKPASRTFELDGIGAYISAVEPGNYGSFLFRMLPALLLLNRTDFALDYLVVPERTSWMMKALDLLGLGHIRVFSAREVTGLICSQIYVVSDIDNEAFLDSLTLNRMLSLAKTCVGRTTDTAIKRDRIYISRALATLRSVRNRSLVNEKFVEAEALRRGFQVLYPETLSFEQQIAIFASAKLVAGPSGSGMLNAAFALPNTQIIDLESFHYTVRQHAKLYASSQKDYGFVFGTPLEESGRPLHSRSWQINIEHFHAALDSFNA